eukprot:TRINITY_DN17236_c0_g1_i1.p1 TRINITY_DN17236_c0_g1~~TRINITY_DN17236_c0_g1_i1.p1  ORF type:complete len:140 (+),score=6.28 TRINITY_DN17236_c0_g1_i1:112-531(+)
MGRPSHHKLPPRQLYAADDSPPIWRPILILIVLAAFCLVTWLTAVRPLPPVEETGKVVKQKTGLGFGRDQQGCLHTAGYTWCEGAGKCIRPWKDDCPGGTDFCKVFCAEQKGAGMGASSTHTVFCRCAEISLGTVKPAR